MSEAKRRLKGPQRFRYCPFGRFSSKLYTPWENLESGTPYDSERRNRAPLLVDKLKEAVTGWKTCYAFKMPPSDKMLFEGMTTIAGFGPLIKLGKGAKAAKGVDKANDARQAVDKARKAAKAGDKVHDTKRNVDKIDKVKKSRQRGDRMTSQENTLDQLDEIEKAQSKARRSKSGKKIDSIEKSKQRAKNKLKDIRNREDLRDFDN